MSGSVGVNRKAPEKLLKEAQELGCQIDVPEAELRNIYASVKGITIRYLRSF